MGNACAAKIDVYFVEDVVLPKEDKGIGIITTVLLLLLQTTTNTNTITHYYYERLFN